MDRGGGELRIGLLTLAAGAPMFDALVSGFEQRFPACRVEVLEAFPGKALQRLHTGELDALVHWLPLRQPGISVGPVLLDDAPVLAVQVGHPPPYADGRAWRTWPTSRSSTPKACCRPRPSTS